ncbi:hypothetical protein [Brachybacterium hainanense]|uniref:Uncharacterized protein n=1 Tax=Brachybacterium hainanense TaxID=1541174 RepID=A0ABV6R602_9MICO
MITYDPSTAAFRGPNTEIDGLRDALADPGRGPVAEVLAGLAPEIPPDPGSAALGEALRRPLFTLEVGVSGPGAQHRHRLIAADTGVGVRTSPLKDGLSELAAFPLATLPGGITRLVRFRPGPAPAEDAPTIPVPVDDLGALASSDAAERRRGWDLVGAALDAALPPAADPSWQIVEVRCTWTSVDGTDAEDLSVHLRRGDDHLLVQESDEGMLLVPVTSIRAWESMIHVLPEQSEIAPPRA